VEARRKHKNLRLAVSAVENRFVFSIEIACAAEDRELVIAELWDRGVAGIVELGESGLRAFFEDEEEIRAVQALYPGAATREEENRNWVETARDLLQPMEVGERFFLVPEWRDDPAPAGRFRMVVNPGMAFGTGVHETTRLCLEALERYVRPGMDVLDVGTGSGILARAAALLGARRVYACDIDTDAVAIAGQGHGPVPLRFIGSVDAVRGGISEVVVANISPQAITRLAPDLMRARRRKGVLLASGFEVQEIEQVKAALGEVREVRTNGSWAMVVA
jgi:ribosomal protein L11 methyltransferase